MSAPFRIGTPTAWQDLGSQTVPLATQPFVPVVERCDTYHGTDGTNSSAQWVTTAGRFGRTVHRVSNPGATQLQLRYANWVSVPAGSGGGEVANGNSITVRCSVEYPAGVYRIISGSTAYAAGTTYATGDQVTSSGAAYVSLADSNSGHTPSSNPTWWQSVTRYAVTFTGADANRVITVAAGVDVVSLPVALTTPLCDGTRVAVNTIMTTGNASNTIPPCDNIGAWDYAVNYTTTGAVPAPAADLVDIYPTTQTPMAVATGSTSAPGTALDPTWDAAANKLPRPVVITGNAPATRYTCIIGDSLVMAYLDGFVDGWQPGFAGRAYERQGAAYWRVSQGGDRMQWLQPSNAARRIALAQQAPTILCDLGANDIANSRTLAQLQADAQTCWTALAAGGARVFAFTVFPQSTSTNSWADVANQTARFPVGSVRDTYNGWLRAGASMTVDGQTVTIGQLGHPIAELLDVSSAFEAPTDPTKILTNGSANYATQDGAHPTAAANTIIATAMAPSVPRILAAASTLHASTHATGSTDPITPASIGAADTATLGGYLSPLDGAGALTDFLLYGDLYSSIPRWFATSAYPTARQTLVLILGQIPATAINGAKVCVTTAVASSTATVYPFWGASLSTMTRQTSLSISTAATGPASATYGSPLSLAAGYLAAVIVLSSSSCAVAAGPTPTAPSGFVNPTATVQGYITGSTTPGSTSSFATYPSLTGATSQKVWLAFS